MNLNGMSYACAECGSEEIATECADCGACLCADCIDDHICEDESEEM